MNKSLQIVTCEQARKLNKLKFNWESDNYYVRRNEFDENRKELRLINKENALQCDLFAPTTSLAIKWLRDEEILKIHNKRIFVYVFECNDYWRFNIDGDDSLGENYKDYEEAESAGLDYALDYLTKNKKHE